MGVDNNQQETFSAYSEDQCLAQGTLVDAALAARRHLDQQNQRRALILQDSTCQVIDLDLSGDEALLARKAEHFPLAANARNPADDAPVAKEITLLPRHWDWLAQQQSSPAAVLRRLIDEARRDPYQRAASEIRHHQNLTYRFCQTLCGDLPSYEEALRALFARDESGFLTQTANWPSDLARQARQLAAPIWRLDIDAEDN